MKRIRLVPCLCLPLVLAAATAVAQPPARPGPQASRIRPAVTEREKLRLQLAAFEGVLVTAVTQIHSQALEAAMPAMFTFEGGTRASGFRLDGYGVFFHVDLPPLPRSFAWTVRVLDTPAQIEPELALLRRQAAEVNDARLRQQLEQVITRIERKMPSAGQEGMVVSQATTGAGDRVRGEPDARVDPFRDYAADLGSQLAEIVLNFGGTIEIGADEWLTVAAREMEMRLLPGGPAETSVTLRIKGADLAAFKAGRLTHDEARKRVEIKHE